MTKLVITASVIEQDSVGRMTRHFNAEFPTSEFQFAIALHDQLCSDGAENVQLFCQDANGVKAPMRNKLDWQRIQKHLTAAANERPHGSAHVISGPFSGPRGNGGE